MSIENRPSELGISLPPASKPAGSYVPAVVTGNLIFVSGHLPSFNGKVQFVGKVGREVELDRAVEAARLCVVDSLAAMVDILGQLDRIKRIVRVEVFVNSAPGFTDQPKVANGASDLLHDIFGEAGRHTRVAVGVAELPLDAAVEISLVAEIE